MALVTESVTSLPAELVGRYGINIIPAQISVDGRFYPDDREIYSASLYKTLWAASTVRTAPPSPGAYLAVFDRLGQQYEGILCVTLSSKFSSLNNSASIAAQDAGRTVPKCAVRVLDSGSATMGAGFVVLAAARAASEGAGMDEVLRVAEEVKEKVRLAYLLDTLHHIARTGRIPALARMPVRVASAMGIRPVVSLKHGDARPLTFVRARKKGIDRLVRYLDESAPQDTPLHAAVVHAFASAEAETLKALVAARYRCAELLVVEASPIIAACTGPGLLGLAFYAD